jgi:hypothetical protein
MGISSNKGRREVDGLASLDGQYLNLPAILAARDFDTGGVGR